MNNTRNYRRGDIYLSKTGPRIGNRSSTRAVLLLQNDADEFYSTSVFAVPIAMKPSPFPAPSDDVRVYLTSMSLVQYSRAGAVDKSTDVYKRQRPGLLRPLMREICPGHVQTQK